MRNRPAGEVRSGALSAERRDARVQKITYVCVLILRVGVAQNPASHLPAGLQMPYAPILNPRDLKRKRAGFSGPPATAGLQTAFGSKEKRPARGVSQSCRAPGVRRGNVRREVCPSCAVCSATVGRIVTAGRGLPNRVWRWALRARFLELHHEPVDD